MQHAHLPYPQSLYRTDAGAAPDGLCVPQALVTEIADMVTLPAAAQTCKNMTAMCEYPQYPLVTSVVSCDACYANPYVSTRWADVLLERGKEMFEETKCIRFVSLETLGCISQSVFMRAFRRQKILSCWVPIVVNLAIDRDGCENGESKRIALLCRPSLCKDPPNQTTL